MAVLSTSLSSRPVFGGGSGTDEPQRSWRRLRDAALGPESDVTGFDGATDRSAAAVEPWRGDSSPRQHRAVALERAPAKPETRAERRERLLHLLVESAAPRGFHIARDLLGSREEAEDAVQEALARACEQCHRIREPEAVEGWFYRVLTNLCLKTLRRRRLRRLFLGREQPADGAPPPAISEPGADRQLAHNQDVTHLLAALDRVPSKQRTALLLRYGHDLPVGTIADMLGVSPATVKTHLVRGLRRLRKTMERNS